MDNLNQVAAKAKSVCIVWIPAHKGHVGNERADALAKQGAGEMNMQLKLGIREPVSSFKAKLKLRIYEEWEREWNSSSLAKHTKTFYKKPDANKAKYVYKLSRLELGRVVRLVTGHNNLNFFQAKLGYSDTGTCRFCNDGEETITHLMGPCVRFIQTRADIFRGIVPGDDMRWSVRELLRFSYTPCINDALEGAKPIRGSDQAECLSDAESEQEQ